MRHGLALVIVALVALPAAAQVTVTGVTPSIGPTSGGTTITITGTNLAWSACFPICNQGAVVVGGVPVSVIGNSNPSSITILTPPHTAGTVDIVVFPSGYPNGFPGHRLPNAFIYSDEIPALGGSSKTLLATLLLLLGLVLVKRA
jgi:hypothetical protein